MAMREPQFTKGPLHVVDQGPDRFLIVCGEGGTDAWVAVVNSGPEAMANANLFAHANALFDEAERSRIALESAAALLAISWPAHAGHIREQAEQMAKTLAKARGE